MQQAPKAKTIENKYYQRTAGTARPCWVCYKETTTVLATLDKADFLYTCPSHLSDRNFASCVNPAAPAAPVPSQEEIGKVIAEYEAREKKRKAEAAAKGNDKDKDGKDDDKEKEKAKGSVSPQPPVISPQPTHNVYALHRDFYAMRLAEQRKRDNLQKANAVSKELPRAPSNLFPLARPRPTGDGGAAL